MAWVAGADVTTGDLITAAQWNNYLGATGSLEHLGTPELWVPASSWYDNSGAVWSAPTWDAAELKEADDRAYMYFKVPDIFASLAEAVIVVRPLATQAAADWDIYANYGATGENYIIHTESDLATTYNVTNNQFFEVNASGILTALAAGDHVQLILINKNSAHDVGVFGFFMRYNA